MRVPLHDVAALEAMTRGEVHAAVARVADSGRFVLGPDVATFERWLASESGAAHAVGVASGTDAIELALRALGVGPGDAVVTPALSFVAAAEAIAQAGARPVFCDVEPTTLLASARTVAAAVDRASRTGLAVRAVVPVHLFGASTASDLRTFAAGAGLAFVEDAAQALGARDDTGQPPGRHADAAAFSFFPTKPLGGWGDGGAIVTSREDVAERVRSLRAHGARAQYVHEELGRNSRLDTVQAAALLAKTPYVERWRSVRAGHAARYTEAFARLPVLAPHLPAPPGVHAWHAYVIRCERRDALARFLADRGVASRTYYPRPLHRQPCFLGLGEPELPVAEEACRTALALPLYGAMTDAQGALVIEHVAAFFDGGSG